MKICKVCSQEVKVFHGHGMCGKCYREDYKKKNPNKPKEYYENNKEKWSYEFVDKDKKKIRDKKYAETHKEQIKERKKQKSIENAVIISQKNKERYEKNKEKIAEKQKTRRQERTLEEKEKERQYQREYKIKNAEQLKENKKQHNEKNKAKIQERKRKKRQENLEEFRKRDREYSFNKRHNDPFFRMIGNLRGRNRKFFTRTVKKYHTKQLLNCDEQFFLNHFISRFKEGMTIENYGKVWHIDHIIPLNYFDPTNEEDKLIACNINNIQPLFGPENDAKHDKLPENYLEILSIIKEDLAKKSSNNDSANLFI